MYNFLIRKGVLMGFLLALLAIIITVIPISLGIDAFDAVPEKQQAFSEEGSIFGVGITVARVLLFISILLMVVLGIVGIFKDLKSSMKGVIGFVVIVVFFGILYATASTDVSGELATIVANPEFGVTDNIFKLVSGGITGTVILLFVAFIAIVLMEVWSFFKTA